MTRHSLFDLPGKMLSALWWILSPQKLDREDSLPAYKRSVSFFKMIFTPESLDELPPDSSPKKKTFFQTFFSSELLDELPPENMASFSFWRWLFSADTLEKDPESLVAPQTVLKWLFSKESLEPTNPPSHRGKKENPSKE